MFSFFSAPPPETCPSKARALLKQKALLVDVREVAEVKELGFDSAEVVNIPLSQLNQRFAEIPRDRPVILACAAGARSQQATRFLIKQGYDNVTNMSGGMAKWLHKGFPVNGINAPSSQMMSDPCECSHGPDKVDKGGCCH